MNLCEALQEGRKQNKAIRMREWPDALAWYHGTDNAIRWFNGDSDSLCVKKTGDEVHFSVADFNRDDYELHLDITYHGPLDKFHKAAENFKQGKTSEPIDLDKYLKDKQDTVVTDRDEKVEFCLLDIELSDEAEQRLVDYAIERIVHDRPELINYAVNEILKRAIEKEKEHECQLEEDGGYCAHCGRTGGLLQPIEQDWSLGQMIPVCFGALPIGAVFVHDDSIYEKQTDELVSEINSIKDNLEWMKITDDCCCLISKSQYKGYGLTDDDILGEE